MASAGPKNGTNFSDNAALGTVAWANPGNAAASDNAYAVATTLGPFTSHYEVIDGFGFTSPGDIPAGATIDGVLFEIEGNGNGDGAAFIDASMVLLVNGAGVGTDQKRSGATFWPAADAYQSIGGAANLWGTGGLTVSQIVTGTGIGIALAVSTAGASKTCRIDHVRCTVFFTPGSAPINVPCNGATGTGSGTLAITAPTNVPLSGASASGSGTLALVVPAGVPLAGASGQGSGTLALTAPTRVPLNGATAQGSGVLNLYAPGPVTLLLSGATGAGSGTMTATTTAVISGLSALGQGSGTLSLTTTFVGRVSSWTELAITEETNIRLSYNGVMPVILGPNI